MDDRKTVNTTMWIMVLIQTIGSVDLPGSGARKMPSPRAYVAIVILWSTLAVIAETSASKFAARMAVALTVTGAVLGPFGQRFASFLGTAANAFPAVQHTSHVGGSSNTQPQGTQ